SDSVSQTAFGEQITWLRKIQFDFPTQPAHENAQMLNIVQSIGTPGFARQLLMRDYLTGKTNQRGEQFVCDRRQMNFTLAQEDLARRKIDFQASDLEHRQLIAAIHLLGMA